MLGICFSLAQTWKLVIVEEKMMEVNSENFSSLSLPKILDWVIVSDLFQQDNDSKNIAETTIPWFNINPLNVLE